MYNIAVELPSVDWSTVPGPRSRGYNLEKGRLEESDVFDARVEKFETGVERELRFLGLTGCFVVESLDGKELRRIKIWELYS
jgi:hypothetical protein